MHITCEFLRYGGGYGRMRPYRRSLCLTDLIFVLKSLICSGTVASTVACDHTASRFSFDGTPIFRCRFEWCPWYAGRYDGLPLYCHSLNLPSICVSRKKIFRVRSEWQRHGTVAGMVAFHLPMVVKTSRIR